MALPLSPMPNDGTPVEVTTTDCTVDESVMLEITQKDVVRYAQAIKVNATTKFKLPTGRYRFNFHFQKVDGPATFNCSVAVPSTEASFPIDPAVGSGTKQQGKWGLVAYRVIV
ncbi:hypothetical protein [Novosphingobium sp.]|uniref:hypothetical protein n=1 Tax=Novosphingobium sp. TaxID=1874826 RepID=UPI00286BC27C|nr:hypothetical protein [Novosphingobium sp.]